MPMLARLTRTSTEVDGLRAEAEWKLEQWGVRSPYTAERMAVLLEVCDWLNGSRDAAPATGEFRPADEDGIAAEWSAARGMDERAWSEGRGGDAVRPQTVAEALAWYLCDPCADSPA